MNISRQGKFLIIAQALDIFSTLIFTRNPELVELNPLANGVGLYPFIALKIIVMSAVIYFMEKNRQYKIFEISMLVLAIITSLVVLINIASFVYIIVR